MLHLVGIATGKKLFEQPIPHRFYIDFNKHLKKDLSDIQLEIINDKVLDWPRHWRK